ncbi:MAG: type II toxin-antitoxin system VapC family toxin [Chthoniobacterales bacterium]|nr:type II toxin-antitoxin system VapC family toxin [Chthoniobacterales bacterium]
MREPGSEEVREHALKVGSIACCEIGQIELAAVFHRHLREGRLNARQYGVVMRQLASDLDHGIWVWLPLTPVILAASRQCYEKLPPKFFLRAADAMHLSCAAGNGFSEVFTNDRHMLVACAAFGLAGRNVIS